MIEELIQIIRENNRIPDEVKMDRDSRLDTDIGLSSFDLMEVLTVAEETYGIAIPRERIPGFSTLGDVADCIEELRGNAERGGEE